MRWLGLFILAFLALPLGAKAQQGWYPVATPFDIQDLDVSDDSTLAILSGSSVATTTNGGVSWSSHHSILIDDTHFINSIKSEGPGAAEIFGYRILDPVNGIYAAQSFTTIDGGKSWSAHRNDQSAGAGYRLVDHGVHAPCYGTFPAITFQKGCSSASTLDGIIIWHQATTRLLYGVEFHDSVGIGLAIETATDYRHLRAYHTNNFGASWSLDSIILRDPYYYCASVRRSKDLWFIPDSTRLLSSTDADPTWRTVKDFGTRIQAFGFFDSVGYVSLFNADYVEKTTDLGRTWFAQSCTNGEYLVGNVIPTSTTTAYAWGGGSGFMKTADGGGAGSLPVLSIARVVNFSQIPPDSEVTQRVIARNVGIDTLRVTGFTADSANVSVIPSTFELSSGDSITLSFHFKTHNGAGDKILLTFQTNCLPQQQVVVIRGTAQVPVLGYSNRTFDFGTVRIGEAQTMRLRMTNLGNVKAIFQPALVTAPVFTAVRPDTLVHAASEDLIVRFSPKLAQPYAAMVIVRSNELMPDTLTLLGTGAPLFDPGVNVRLDWVKVDTVRSSVATNVTSYGSDALTLGFVHPTDSTLTLVDRVFGNAGQELHASTIRSTTALLTNHSVLAGDSRNGFEVASVGTVNTYPNLFVDGFDPLVGLRWSDTFLLSGTKGVNPNAPIALVSNKFGECAAMCSGFAYGPSSGTNPGDLSQVFLKHYAANGHATYGRVINGTSQYFFYRVGFYGGVDYGVDLIAADTNFVASLTLDDDQNGDLTAQTVFNRTPYLFPIPSQDLYQYRTVNSSGGGKLAYYTNRIVEVGKMNDTGYAVITMDDSRKGVWQTGLPHEPLLDSVYSLVIDSSSGAIALVATNQSDLEGRNTEVIRLSSSGQFLWQRTFNGLGSGDDIPVKIIAERGFTYVLVKSMDTSGDDFVLLKYDSLGKQLYRLRYDGAGHGEDDPRDFALGPNGAIYIVGGSANAKGVQQFTVLKYIDSARALLSTPIVVEPAHLEARLTQNPWSTSTTLQITRPSNARVTIRISDLLGRSFFTRTTNGSAIALSSVDLPHGFYTISLEAETGERTMIKCLRE